MALHIAQPALVAAAGRYCRLYGRCHDHYWSATVEVGLDVRCRPMGWLRKNAYWIFALVLVGLAAFLVHRARLP